MSSSKKQSVYRTLFQKRKNIHGRLMLIVLMASLLGAAQAQRKTVFSEVREVGLAADQSKALGAIRAQPTTKRVRIVQLDLAVLDQAEGAILNVLPSVNINLPRVSIERRSAADYTWHGANRRTDSEAVLVVRTRSLGNEARATFDPAIRTCARLWSKWPYSSPA